ncbi:hypothetical protein [Roseibium sp. Sym1]|uniref:hypothetical protein n=1 Tax=Roseibium sp. Sym1 TaxID=3016006 RepID=UPI0022B4B75A|nr:hypothetical protein [Roseibium sp. Sym1]
MGYRDYWTEVATRAFSESLKAVSWDNWINIVVKILMPLLIAAALTWWAQTGVEYSRIVQVLLTLGITAIVAIIIFFTKMLTIPPKMHSETLALVPKEQDSEREAAILKLVQLRHDGVRHRNDGKKIEDEGVEWSEESLQWMEDVIATLTIISPAKAEMFRVLDTVPQARHRCLSDDKKFRTKFAMHDYRLVRLTEIADNLLNQS